MGQVGKLDMNFYEMGSRYQDPLNSSARSRETDSNQSSEAGDPRVRLMCSYGGKIQRRAHDNQLSYVGGDTRILAVDRNIRFSGMVGKLSSLWKSSVSFKYQLPNEGLDALVSVTNDEDMENMMAEYDRLQKMGCRSSRLRLFVFPDKPDGASSQSSLGLNIGSVRRSENALQGPRVNNMPDFLSDRVEDDRNSGKRGYARQETDRKKQKIQSASNSPMIGHSSLDSTSSSSAPINTVGSAQDPNQVKRGGNSIFTGRDLTEHLFTLNPKLDSSIFADSRPELEIVAGNSNEQEPQRPQLQVPIQELQKLQLRPLQAPSTRPEDDSDNLSIQGRRKSFDSIRVVNSSSPHMTMPIPTLNEAYFLSNSRPVDSTTGTLNQDPNQVETGGNLGHNFEQNSVFAYREHSFIINPKLPSSSTVADPFTINPKLPSNSTVADSRLVPDIVVRNSNEQAPQKLPLQVPIQELQKLQLGQRQNLSTQRVDNNANLNIPGTSSPNMIKPNPTLNETYLMPNSRPIDSTIKNLAMIDPKKIEPNKVYTQSQHNPSLAEYGVNGQGSHFLARESWQMHEPHGGQLSQYHPVNVMHEGSPTLQPMTTVRVVGQPAAGGSGGYYNPGQRVTAPSDVRVVYRPTPPVPLVHKEPYSYQNVGPYEPVYYMQAPPVPSPQCDSTTVANVNSEDFHDTSPPKKSKEQLGTSGPRGQ